MAFKKNTLILIAVLTVFIIFGILLVILSAGEGNPDANKWDTLQENAARFVEENTKTETAAAAANNGFTTTAAVTAGAPVLTNPVQDESAYNDGYASGYAAGLLDGEKRTRSGNDQESYQKGYEAGMKDARMNPDGTAAETVSPIAVTVSGSFTATVRAVLPDYQTDDKTMRAAVIQFERDGMFVMNIAPEVCKLLTPDETYTFLVDEQTVNVPSLDYLLEDGVLSADILKTQYIEVGSVRAPRSAETGSRSTRLTYKIAENDNKGEIT